MAANSYDDEIPDGKVTRQTLKTQTGEFDIESIHVLNFRKKGICDLGCIGECTGLERLDLSYNDVTKLFALAGLARITYLNLSANRISNLEGLQSLDNLRELNLAGNLISSVDTLRCLMGLEYFEELRLKDIIKGIGNPMCMNNSYRSDVMNILPKLRTLDGERLRGKGSEIFKMLNEIEDHLNTHNRSDLQIDRIAPPAPWFPSDHFSPETEFTFEEAESQFRDLMTDCSRMLQDAEVQIETITRKPESGDG